MDSIIHKTQSMLFEDHLELEADDTSAAKEYALTLLAKVISSKKINAKLAYTILLKAWNPAKDEIDFHHSPFWIRIFGLPPNKMTKSNAEKIGARIGNLKEIDFTADGNIAWCKFLRIQVEIDIQKSIHTGFHRTKEASPSSWINLRGKGNPFTWSNNWPLLANIRERLDKAYANIAWCTLFPYASVTHLPGKASDHLPIVLKTHKPLSYERKPFKFEAAWIRDPTSFYVVQSAWNQPLMGTPESVLCKKVESTSKALRKWNYSHFRHIQSRIGQLTSILDKIQQNQSSIRNLELERNIKLELQEQLRREEWL
ncbi:hypothetical protein RJ639_020030 [Escallonia herrerae]|uniref:DUF4283 domain-containing protein n=1 Tax=Escallonia herrerae TaxID=1293975 RepID=A0AA88V6N3_9ASTE|nr:hypothetical protein RJ639_020030 [Escallonia herrerae]